MEKHTLPFPFQPYLLNTGNVLANVLDGHRILHGQTMTLTLDTRLVDQYTRVRMEACRRCCFHFYRHREHMRGARISTTRSARTST